MLGDCENYVSPYMRGIAQAMKLLGHVHTEMSIRSPARVIDQRLRLWKPDVIWTHMLLWPPPGSPPVSDLVAAVAAAAARGSKVVIHDGDAKQPTRYAHSLAKWCSLALVNHGFDRSAWRVPVLKWPYFAMKQCEIARPVEALKCELFFAGTLGGGVYSARTALLDAIKARGVSITVPPQGENTLDRTAEIAASAGAVLGFGRPSVPGWCDVRVFQYPGAGGILIHDDVQGYLDPWTHFVPYRSGDADSLVEALKALRLLSDDERAAMRQRAFERVQAEHSSVARARQALAALEVA